MSECHKTKTTKSRDSDSKSSRYGICIHCERDLDSDAQDWCRFCTPPEARVRIFQLRLPVVTIELIKAKHGNVSAYLRGLIANDLGEDALPAAALQRCAKRPGETDLKSYLEIGKTKPRRTKHGNGSTNHRKVGRIRAAKKQTNQNY